MIIKFRKNEAQFNSYVRTYIRFWFIKTWLPKCTYKVNGICKSFIISDMCAIIYNMYGKIRGIVWFGALVKNSSWTNVVFSSRSLQNQNTLRKISQKNKSGLEVLSARSVLFSRYVKTVFEEHINTLAVSLMSSLVHFIIL